MRGIPVCLAVSMALVACSGDGEVARRDSTLALVDALTATDGFVDADVSTPDASSPPVDASSTNPCKDGVSQGNVCAWDAVFPGWKSAKILGNSLPAGWRPFSPKSFWNMPLPAGATTHPNNAEMVGRMKAAANNVRFGASYLPPIWVVNSANMSVVKTQWKGPGNSKQVDWVNPNDATVMAMGAPVQPSMWPENTPDGHLIVVDPFVGLAWEWSRFEWIDGIGKHSTYNVWSVLSAATQDTSKWGVKLTPAQLGDGNGHYSAATDGIKRWSARGGRGAGVPVIGGLIRPEEVKAGLITHKLAFTLGGSQNAPTLLARPPAARTDGQGSDAADYMREGMVVRLNASEATFKQWGLTKEATVVARALRDYGMVLVDNGGDLAIQLQLLDEDATKHRSKWEAIAPGLYNAVKSIPADQLVVVDPASIGQTIVDEGSFGP